jgi:general secretion pathway protein K
MGESMQSGMESPLKSGAPLPGRQRGVAIITALLVVALAAILVSGLLWRQQVQIRRIENQRLIGQAQWITRSALDWTRLIIRSAADTSPSITYLDGVWAVPIAETKLSDFLGKLGATNAQQGTSTYLSGSIEDAQARFNLRNLVSSPEPGALALDLTQVQAFGRLLTLLGYDGQLALPAATQLRDGLTNSAARFQGSVQLLLDAAAASAVPATGGGSNTPAPGPQPLQMMSVDALLRVPGFTPEMVDRLRPYVTVLPTATKMNMNTATPELISAELPLVSLANAQALVALRERAFFRNTSDVSLAMQGAGIPGTTDPSIYDVTSNYFIVHGRVRHERAEVRREMLLYRDPQTHSTHVISVRDEP